MKTQLIFIAQSVTGAVAEIILLLIGAAVIGFITAWFYQKSHFTPIIKKLEDEKTELNKKIDELNRKIDGLNIDVAGLKVKIADLEKVVAGKDKEIRELKMPRK
jgi:peptidoglycan hydrolase CwlO-like protein